MKVFETDTPEAAIQHVANKIAADENFPATEDYETLLTYVRTSAAWRDVAEQNKFKEVYASYADLFNIQLEWPHSLDFIEANKPEHFNKLTPDEKEILLTWIAENLEPFRTEGYHSIRNSYRLKHSFQFSEVGFYVTGGQFKGAMLASGFKPKDYEALNWEFTLGKNAGITVI
jgi:hypothetical protein